MPWQSSNSATLKRFTRSLVAFASSAELGLDFARRLVSALPGFAPLLAGIRRLLSIGTERYPEDVRRRLKIVNCVAYLIGFTTAIYAIQYSIADYEKYRLFVWINVAILILPFVVPWSHRFSDLHGAMLIVLVEFVALFSLTMLLGRATGPHLHYLIAPGAAFVMLGVGRTALALWIVLAAMLLYLAAHFLFPPEKALISVAGDIQESLYVQTIVTVVVLTAASVWYAFKLVEKARAETDAVLLNTLPAPIVDRLKADPDRLIADSHEEVSVIFTDISGFVALSMRLGPERVVALLNDIVRRCDERAQAYGVEKIKTIGDAYMAVAGVPQPHPRPACAAAALATDMLVIVEDASARNDIDLAIRIGIATGPVTAGVIGTHKFSYDVWGDTVNLAARLESAGSAGRILVCENTCAALKRDHEANGHCKFSPAGQLEIKGQGQKPAWFIEVGDNVHDSILAEVAAKRSEERSQIVGPPSKPKRRLI